MYGGGGPVHIVDGLLFNFASCTILNGMHIHCICQKKKCQELERKFCLIEATWHVSVMCMGAGGQYTRTYVVKQY